MHKVKRKEGKEIFNEKSSDEEEKRSESGKKQTNFEHCPASTIL